MRGGHSARATTAVKRHGCFPCRHLLRPLGYRKVQRYNDTPTFLFQYGFEPRAAEETYTGNILKSVEGKMPKTTGIYAGMATVSGNEVALRAAVTSLLPQVDGLFVYLNEFACLSNVLCEATLYDLMNLRITVPHRRLLEIRSCN